MYKLHQAAAFQEHQYASALSTLGTSYVRSVGSMQGCTG
jgi:hypothetical protein